MMTKTCRLCLKEDENLIQLFEKEDLTQDVKDYARNVNVLDNLRKIFRIQFVKHESISSEICAECRESVESFAKFYDLVLENQIKVYEQSCFPKSPPISDDIKEEENQSEVEISIKEEEAIVSDNNMPATPPIEPQKRKSGKTVIDEADEKILNEFYQFKCDLCNNDEPFSSFTVLQRHFSKSHATRGYFKCCEKKFYLRWTLVIHAKSHLMPNALPCPKCPLTFGDERELKYHLNRHRLREERPFTCEECGKSYVSLPGFKRHSEFAHQTEEERRLRPKYTCDLCGLQTEFFSSLRVHINYIHLHRGRSVCNICGRVCRNKTALRHHLELHSEEHQKRAVCSVCGVKLKAVNLESHMHMVHSEARQEVRCQDCGKLCPTRRALQSHRQYMHRPAERYPCSYCQKVFRKSIALKEHLTTHGIGNGLYSCCFCSHRSNSHANMFMHRKRMHPVEWAQMKAQI